jgi:hypothetical protein
MNAGMSEHRKGVWELQGGNEGDGEQMSSGKEKKGFEVGKNASRGSCFSVLAAASIQAS